MTFSKLLFSLGLLSACVLGNDGYEPSIYVVDPDDDMHVNPAWFELELPLSLLDLDPPSFASSLLSNIERSGVLPTPISKATSALLSSELIASREAASCADALSHTDLASIGGEDVLTNFLRYRAAVIVAKPTLHIEHQNDEAKRWKKNCAKNLLTD